MATILIIFLRIKKTFNRRPQLSYFCPPRISVTHFASGMPLDAPADSCYAIDSFRALTYGRSSRPTAPVGKPSSIFLYNEDTKESRGGWLPHFEHDLPSDSTDNKEMELI